MLTLRLKFNHVFTVGGFGVISLNSLPSVPCPWVKPGKYKQTEQKERKLTFQLYFTKFKKPC